MERLQVIDIVRLKSRLGNIRRGRSQEKQIFQLPLGDQQKFLCNVQVFFYWFYWNLPHPLSDECKKISSHELLRQNLQLFAAKISHEIMRLKITFPNVRQISLDPFVIETFFPISASNRIKVWKEFLEKKVAAPKSNQIGEFSESTSWVIIYGQFFCRFEALWFPSSERIWIVWMFRNSKVRWLILEIVDWLTELTKNPSDWFLSWIFDSDLGKSLIGNFDNFHTFFTELSIAISRLQRCLKFSFS